MIDHIVYAVPNLEAAMDEIERDWGVRPAFGGKHTGRGSHNALLSLGDGPYLELIALDPEQTDVDEAKHPFRLANLTAPVIRTFAITTPGIDAVIARSREAGYDPGDAHAMSRALPDGSATLSWRLTRGTDEATAGGMLPFLIDWADTPHPSGTSPKGCTLGSLRIQHPDAGRIRAVLAALGCDVTIEESETPALVAEIVTPNGPRTIR